MSTQNPVPRKKSATNMAAIQVGLTPYIPATTSLPEITIKAVILGAILAMIMGAANAYLGLKVGVTVSACIPAAVISMAILRMFKTSNILENNIVQTAASAGEVVAAGAVFTLPALIMMGYWDHFPFWITTMILCLGGLLGVLFSIPLRRALVVESPLKYPEGVAAAEVLLAGEGATKGGTKQLVWGGLGAALVKMGQTGWQFLSEGYQFWVPGGKTVLGFGLGFPVVLMGAGYIVGLEITCASMIGGILAWGIGVPLHGFLFGLPEGLTDPAAIASNIWNNNIRMIGIGAMVVGGIWSLMGIIKPIKESVKISLAAFFDRHNSVQNDVIRTEHDIPMIYVLMGVLLLAAPVFVLFYNILGSANLPIGSLLFLGTVLLSVGIALLLGFACASIAGYMSGLVGSSSCPLSGVTILAVLLSALSMWAMMGASIDFASNTKLAITAAAVSVMVGAIVAAASGLGSDTLQDFKTGQIVGATPWKQQVVLLIGVVCSSFIMVPVLEILYEAYGMGSTFPRPGMDPTQALVAPKAAIMAILSQSIFTQSLDWSMFLTGVVVAVLVILVDRYLKTRPEKWSLPVMAVALGFYMPLDISTSFFFGGLIAYFANQAMDKKKTSLGSAYPAQVAKTSQMGLLFASGLIAGDALTGIILAIPFATYQTTDLFKVSLGEYSYLAPIFGTLAFWVLCQKLYHTATNTK